SGVDRTAASERHECDLLAAGITGHIVAVSQSIDAERQVTPVGGPGIDDVPLTVAEEQIAHVNSASSSSSRGIASEHASCDATIAPATEPRRTASSSGSSLCRLWTKA